MAKQGMSIPKLIEQIPDEISAYKFLESLRWADGPVCPHCGSTKAYFLTPKDGSNGRKTRTGSQSMRRVWKCAAKECRKQFSVLTGTVMHGTKISVRSWCFVLFEMCSSKNGVSAREIERKYDLTAESAWHMCHRIREGMKRDPFAGLLSGVVIADETFIGGAPKNRHRDVRRAERPAGAPNTDKTAVFSLVHKETGEVRSQVVANVRRETLRAAINEHVDATNSVLHTDSAPMYTRIGWKFQDHQSVNHIMGEYVRQGVTTNHVEGYFSQLKRSIDGTHHAVSVEHLPRYLAEFDFRYSTRKLTDSDRMAKLLGQVGGRRLTYEPLHPL
jgi:transposase-like protein